MRYANERKRLRAKPPMSIKRLRKYVVAAIDTDGIGGEPYFALMLDPREDYPTFHDMEGLMRCFLQKKYYGHEMLIHKADYNLRYLLPVLVKLIKEGYSAQLWLNGQEQIIYCTIRRGRNTWRIRDTYSLMPVPIEKLVPLAGIELTAGMENKCRIQSAAYKTFTELIHQTFNIVPGISAGSTAMMAFQRTLPEKKIHYRSRPDVEVMARDGFFGGQTFVNDYKEQGETVKIDRNAMYAACMAKGVPVGGACETGDYEAGLPGIYQCEVTAPTEGFRFVPHRIAFRSEYKGKRFKAVLTSTTIEYARECGYTVDVKWGYYWDVLDLIFDKFVSKCETLEHTLRQYGCALPIKLMRNSLYGKFGQRPEQCTYYVTDKETDELTPALDSKTGEFIDYLFYKESTVEQPHMMPVWAAWITAEARITLAKMVTAIGNDKCIYGDTDSIVMTRDTFDKAILDDKIMIGTEYGQWKVDGEYQGFKAIAPKAYAFKIDNEWHMVAKGIPRSLAQSEIEKLREGEDFTVHYIQVPKAAREITRKIGARDGPQMVSRTIRGSG